MSTWFWNIVALFTLCICMSGFIIPQILLIAFRKKLFDVPDERKIHTSLVPRLGGIAFTPVAFFAIFLVLGVNLALGNGSVLAEASTELCPLLFGLCGMLVMFLVGIADDLVGVRYVAKFVAQIFCACLLIGGGIWFNDFHGVLGLGSVPAWIGYPFTVLMIVFIINAVNLIDGIDGLASGLSGIACLIYAVIFYIEGVYFYAMLAVATLGVLLPFFYFNVFGDPAKRKKIFMGDTGSLTIGIVLSMLSLRVNMIGGEGFVDGWNPLVAAFMPLFVPCGDVVRVYLYRVRNGRNPFLPDKNHIHHKLLAYGMSQRWAMVSLIVGTFVLVGVNIILSGVVNVNLLLMADAGLWVGLNIWLSHKVASHR
ncbi:MAG: undecaprenyl/decaprenyl-phosphate alpha-N-acetylglucosaminyl 1-phosphate transferase [Muribaculaceae bacterium]|nr:undecaprenyl/decaprenyl-phosphate alpha-N-acetylglucosaminyl 1-phosphate transferase [Muribaculaceae bacterium]